VEESLEESDETLGFVVRSESARMTQVPLALRFELGGFQPGV